MTSFSKARFAKRRSICARNTMPTSKCLHGVGYLERSLYGRDPPDCGLSVSLLVDIPKSQSSIYLQPISNKKEARHRAQLGAMWSSSPTSTTSVDKDRGPVLLFSHSQRYRPWFKCGETDISSPHMNCAEHNGFCATFPWTQKDPPGVEFCRGSWSPGSSWCKLQQPSIEPATMNE
jgi:hypothetical protein